MTVLLKQNTMTYKRRKSSNQPIASINPQAEFLLNKDIQHPLTEPAQLETLEQIERAKQEWEATVDALPQLVCLLNYQGSIIRANRTVEAWGLGQVSKVRGQTVHELLLPVYPDMVPPLDNFLQAAWEALAEGHAREGEVEACLPKRYWHVQLQPLLTPTVHHPKATDSFAALVIHDITERKQSEQLKNEFLANMNEELQTPLTAIIGYSEIMLLGLDGELPAKMREDVEAILENGQHLFHLITEILDLARLQAGNVRLKKEYFSIQPLFEHLKSQYEPLLSQKSIKFSLEAEPDLPDLWADKVRFHQILTHLVSNALKFTEKGYVYLRAFQEVDWICIQVKDSGMGMNEGDVQTIFENFRQIDGSLTRRAKGAGLGLAITHYLVQMHQGTIQVHSQVGQGTTITVYLPVVPLKTG
jgi:signal transduction histidine kinase